MPEGEWARLTPTRLLRQFDVEEVKTLADLVDSIFKRTTEEEDRGIGDKMGKLEEQNVIGTGNKSSHSDEQRSILNEIAAKSEKGENHHDGFGEEAREWAVEEGSLLTAVMSALNEGLYRRREEVNKNRKEKSKLTTQEEIDMEWLAEKAEFLLRLRNVFGSANSVHFQLYKLFLALAGVHF